MWRSFFLVSFLFLIALGSAAATAAQEQRDSSAEKASENRFNRGTVSFIAGDINSTTIRMMRDLGVVLNDGNKLRILSVAGKGSLQNLLDVLYLDGIDVGIVQTDVLEFAKYGKVHPDLEGVIRYIAKLHNVEMHILVREDIQSVEDLAGKPVNVGLPGSGSFITASVLFGTLDIRIQPLNLDLDLALEQLTSGEIAGLVYVAGKPARVFEKLSGEEGVKLLSLPKAPQLWEHYFPARITDKDYPALVPADQPVETLAVGTVMVVYNWKTEMKRHSKIRRFVDAFFDRIGEFQAPGRHAKWSEVNLAAELPGWSRFEPAEQRLKARAVGVARSDKDDGAKAEKELTATFEQFLRENPLPKGDAFDSVSDEEAVEALYQKFLKWSTETR